MATATITRTTPKIINWLADKAGPLGEADKDGYRMASYKSRWSDIRGLHTQLRSLSDKGLGKYARCSQGGNAPMATYRFSDNDGVLHIIEMFAPAAHCAESKPNIAKGFPKLAKALPPLQCSNLCVTVSY